jgi:hypothetical protein
LEGGLLEEVQRFGRQVADLGPIVEAFTRSLVGCQHRRWSRDPSRDGIVCEECGAFRAHRDMVAGAGPVPAPWTPRPDDALAWLRRRVEEVCAWGVMPVRGSS